LEAASFVWLAAREKILTMNTLRKQHVFVVDTCCTRKRNEESVNHLLLHCEVTCALWSTFFSCFGLSWVMPRVANLYACWWTSSSTQSAAVWKMVHSCLLWCLWKERNDRSFKDRKRTLAELQSLLFNSLYIWTGAFLTPLSLAFMISLFLFLLLAMGFSCIPELRLSLLMIF
jgi:hypothetical protein